MPAYQRFSDDDDDGGVSDAKGSSSNGVVSVGSGPQIVVAADVEINTASASTTSKPDDRSAVRIQMSFRESEDLEKSIETMTELTEIPQDSLNDDMSCSQRFAYRFATNVVVRVVSLLLILTDVICVIVELSIESIETEEILTKLSIAIVTYFVIEVLLRIHGYGLHIFFSRRHILDIVDFVIIMCSFTANIAIYTLEERQAKKHKAKILPKLLIGFRIIRVFMFVRFINEKKNMEKAARKKISQNKMRFVDKKNGFDLDLTYITPRVIAMSFPSVGLMAIYRNPIKEVVRFFATKHPNAFRIYNLCSEREYDASQFDGRVERYFIDDHNVPPLEDMIRFAKDVDKFLSENESNVVSVHCKGGKGRTGTMICTWLLHSKEKATAKEALDFFGVQRTDFSRSSKFQGVETPSQSRYVGYYETLLRDFSGSIPPPPELVIKSVQIRKLLGVGSGDGSDLRMQVFKNRTKVFECDFGAGNNCLSSPDSSSDVVNVTIRNCPSLSADVKVKFVSSHQIVPGAYDNCAFFFWFHTAFIDPESLTLYIPREELDNPHKSKTWSIYREGFGVQLVFDHYVVLDNTGE